MNITKKISFGLMLLILFIEGCVSSPPTNLTMVTTPTSVETFFPTQINTSIPTTTYAPEVYPQLKMDCIEMVSSFDVQLKGTLVLQDYITREIELYDLASGKNSPLSKAVSMMTVSPDNKNLAYTEEETGNLKIIDVNGNTLSTISVPPDWTGVLDWLPQDQLLINRFVEEPFQLASTIVLNLSDSSIQEYDSDYPGIITSIPPMKWGKYSYTRTVYNNQLSRVVYLGADEHLQPIIVLWDVENDQEIAEFYKGYDTHIGGAPQWIQSGRAFIMGMYPQRQTSDIIYKNIDDGFPYEGGHELVLVNEEGEIQRLTYFTTKNKTGEEGFSLSTSEKKIAFWLNLNYEPGDLVAKRELTILDISSGESINFCIEGGSVPVPVIWSPDDRYLVVSRYPVEGDLLSEVILVDLKERKAVKIGENVIAQGWLEN